jgi:hypothetical protein
MLLLLPLPMAARTEAAFSPPSLHVPAFKGSLGSAPHGECALLCDGFGCAERGCEEVMNGNYSAPAHSERVHDHDPSAPQLQPEDSPDEELEAIGR